MNKAFSRFLDQSLKKEYEAFTFENFKLEVKVAAGLMVTFALARFVSSMFFENQQLILFEGGFLVYSVVILLISLKGSNQLLKHSHVVTNCLFSLLQLYAYKLHDYKSIYENGQVIMILNMMFYYFIGKREAAIQIIVCTALKAWMQYYIREQFLVCDLFYQGVGGALLLVFVYFKELHQKLGFRQEQFSQKLIQLVPKIIKNEFFLFSYDNERLNFNLRLKSKIKSLNWDDSQAPTQNFRKFLRSYYINDQTIEDFIFKREKSFAFPQCQNNQEQLDLTIFSERKDNFLNITFTEYLLDEQCYIILINDNQNRNLQNIQHSLIYGINMHQQLTISFLQKQLAQISLVLTSKNQLELLYRLKIHCMYFLGKYTQINSFSEIDFNVSKINLTHLSEQIINLYSVAYPTLYFKICSTNSEDIIFESNEQLISIFLITILQQIVRVKGQPSESSIIIGKEKQKDFTYIFLLIKTESYFELKYHLQANTIFQKIQRRLCPSLEIQIINQCIQILYLAIKLLLYENQQLIEEIRQLEEEII